MREIQICAVLIVAMLVRTTESSQKDNAHSIINANNKFAPTMYDMLSENQDYMHFFCFSPIGLHMALSMLQQGAEDRTLATLSSVLNLPDKASSADGYERITRGLNNMENVTFQVSTKLYIDMHDYTIKPAFKDVVEQKFNTKVEDVSFYRFLLNNRTAEMINTWVENKTHHKIKDLIKSNDIDQDSKSVLVNAIYFKADWLVKFDKSRTWPDRVYTGYEGENRGMDMMHLLNKIDYKFDSILETSIIRLPYANKDLSMVFILSNKNTTITDLEYRLANYNLSTLTEGMAKRMIYLTLPRFKSEMKIDLTDPLIQAGLWDIFSKKANFSGLHDSKKHLAITKVLQTLYIDMNEDGREDAPIYTDSSIEKDALSVKVNYPFIFALQRKRNILLYGTMKDPFFNYY